MIFSPYMKNNHYNYTPFDVVDIELNLSPLVAYYFHKAFAHNHLSYLMYYGLFQAD